MKDALQNDVIQEEEDLCRLVASPGSYNERMRKVTVEAFSLYHRKEDYISVFRRKHTNDTELLQLGTIIKVWPPREQKLQQFRGDCLLKVGEVLKESQYFMVKAYTKSHRAHAGIHLKKENGEYYTDQDQQLIKNEEVIDPRLYTLQIILQFIANKRETVLLN